VCCVMRAVAHLRGDGDRIEWSSGRIVISKGKLKSLEQKCDELPLRRMRFSHEVPAGGGGGATVRPHELWHDVVHTC
jgi:hypothetical protein